MGEESTRREEDNLAAEYQPGINFTRTISSTTKIARLVGYQVRKSLTKNPAAMVVPPMHNVKSHFCLGPNHHPSKTLSNDNARWKEDIRIQKAKQAPPKLTAAGMVRYNLGM